MTWEILTGLFTVLAAFISVITVAVKVNRALVLLESAVRQLDRDSEIQKKKNEEFTRGIASCKKRIMKLELDKNNT